MSHPLSRSQVLSLCAVCVLAFLPRAWGLDWGLPRIDLNPDELMVLHITQRLHWGSLDPGFYNYSGLTFYLHFLATEVARAFGVAITDANELFAHRVVGLLLGTLTALLVYPIGRRLRLGHATGVLAAAIMALLPLHVWDSHFAVADVGLAFWSTLALWLALRAYDTPSLGRFVLGGVAVGAAIATKFNGALAGATFIAAAMLVWWEGRARASVAIRNLFAAGAASLVAFALASPYSVIHLGQTLAAFHVEWFEVRAGHYGFDLSAAGWQYHRGLYQLVALFPFAFGLAMWPAVLGGAVLLTRRSRLPQRALIWSHTALYLGSIASWSLVPMRYYLPILPMGAIFGAYGLMALRRWSRPPRSVAVGLFLLVLGYTVAFTTATTYRFTNDTRIQAGRWGDLQLPRGARVYLLYPGFRQSYMPRFTRPDITVRAVPLERARSLAAFARRAPERTWIVVTSLTYQRDYRQGANAAVPGAHRRWHHAADPIGQWEFIRNNPDTFHLVKRFSSWFPNKALYMAMDPMYEGYFVSPTIELYRYPGDRTRAVQRRLRARTHATPEQRPEP